jgi:hypothetical protein
MVNICILELTNNKYYIGKTNNPEFRLEQHLGYVQFKIDNVYFEYHITHFNTNLGLGSAWTKKYQPTKVIKVIPNCDDFDEDKYTLKYMSMYGVDNVRGGSFCQIKLDDTNIQTISRMINGSTDKCYKCGGNHFHSVCSYNLKSNTCERCERKGHNIDACYATTDKNGDEIIDYDSNTEEDTESDIDVFACDYCGKEFETEKGSLFHENVHCKKKYTSQNKSVKNKCFRCGRDNHYADECYASKHINGKYLK